MLYAIVAVVILIFDQAMKYWTTMSIELNTGVKELIPGLIDLNYVRNTGAGFGMLSSIPPWIFTALVVIFCAIVIGLLHLKIIRGKWGCYSIVLVLSGAIGNGIDRVINGYVVDMFRFQFINFPVFNIADIFITVGGVLFCLYILLYKEPFENIKSVFQWRRDERDVRAAKAAAYRSVPRREKPVQTPPVKPADPGNPFAEWLGPRSAAASAAQATRVIRSVEAEPDVRFVETTADEIIAELPEAEAQKPDRPPRHSDDMAFSIEDIIDEFKGSD